MKEKVLTIQIPEGYVDAELVDNKIVFKKEKDVPWKDRQHVITGFYIEPNSSISEATEDDCYSNQDSHDDNIFVTKKQAKSALAMAQLSQIIENDERFGGPVTDREWKDENIKKYVIARHNDSIAEYRYWSAYFFLAFHTKEQRNLFMKENMNLIRQYYMLD